MPRSGAALEAPPPGDGREAGVALVGLVAMFSITAAWWALALWPVADSPGWLERTRYVCFGVSETGLPDAAGWVGLIGGPAGMLGILLVGCGRGVRDILVRSRHSRAVRYTLRTLGIGIVALLLGAGHVVGSSLTRTRRAAEAVPLPAASYPRLDRAPPPLRLLAHDGVDRGLEDFVGRSVLVGFAYAHCATVCPLVVKDALGAQAIRRAEGALPPAVLIVTLDPWRDTPSRLPVMARGWGLPEGSAWVLGGSVEAVELALTAWEVPRTRNERTGEVVHPSLIYVVDPQGRIAYAATGGAEVLAELARRVENPS